MDVLGDVLLSLRLLATRIGILDFGCPWGIASPPPPPHHVVGVTLLEGALWFAPDGGTMTRLEVGDTVLIMNGIGYRSVSDPAAGTVPLESLVEEQRLRELSIGGESAQPEIHWGDGPERTRLLHIALIAQDGGASAILAKLPPIIMLRSGQHGRPPWLDAAVAFLAAETPARPGFTAGAARLVEWIFTSILREHILEEDALGPEWVSELRDPRLGRALAAIHRRPDAHWTVEQLAREAGMARSTFAKRFVELIGQAPIDYLIAHRMQLAFGRMAGDKQPVSAVAQSLGYRSERAFREAFRMRFGMSPTQYLKPQE